MMAVVVASQTCSFEVAVENYQSILCQKPAVVVVDRRERGRLRLCREHINDPAIYADVKANGWTWHVVGSTKEMA